MNAGGNVRGAAAVLVIIGVVAQACSGSADQGIRSQPSTQLDVVGGTTGTATPGGTNSGGAVAPGSSVGGTGGLGATSGTNTNGITAVTGGGGAGGASSSPSTSCPAYAPEPGDSCAAGTVCTYPDSGGACSNTRVTEARCSEAHWAVTVPMDCAQDLSKSNCGIEGMWRLDASGDSGGVRGIPYETVITISHDDVGQYYVSQAEAYAYSSFSYSSKDCTLQAHYDYDTIIPPPNGSTCGLVSSDCDLEVVFSNGAGQGTLTCTGHPNTCVGVYGGSAVLQVEAVRVRAGS